MPIAGYVTEELRVMASLCHNDNVAKIDLTRLIIDFQEKRL